MSPCTPRHAQFGSESESASARAQRTSRVTARQLVPVPKESHSLASFKLYQKTENSNRSSSCSGSRKKSEATHILGRGDNRWVGIRCTLLSVVACKNNFAFTQFTKRNKTDGNRLSKAYFYCYSTTQPSLLPGHRRCLTQLLQTHFHRHTHMLGKDK